MNKKWLNFFWDAILPLSCLGCGREGEALCSVCASALVPVKQPTCFFCGKISSHFESCESCREKTNLTGLIAAFYYEELAKRLMTRFKYYDFAALSDFMAESMLSSLLLYPVLRKRFDYVAGVPLHFWRQAFRGYNQAHLLARRISQALSLPLLAGLKKRKTTYPQAKLSLKERRENLSEAFAYDGPPLLQSKVLLVDDVATSGETLNQAAKVLRTAGAKEIWGITFAKG